MPRKSCAKSARDCGNCKKIGAMLSAPLEQLRQVVAKAEAAVEATEEQSEEKWRFTLDLITRTSELGDLLKRQKDVAAVQQRLNDAQSSGRGKYGSPTNLFNVSAAPRTPPTRQPPNSASPQPVSALKSPDDRLTGIEVDGTPLANPPAPIEAVKRVDIVIPERGRILIDPTVTDRDQLLHAERAARTALRASLGASGGAVARASGNICATSGAISRVPPRPQGTS